MPESQPPLTPQRRRTDPDGIEYKAVPAFQKFKKLIEKGDESVNAIVLKQALEAGKITPQELNELSLELLERAELIEEGLLGVEGIDPLTRVLGKGKLIPELEKLIKSLNFSNEHRKFNTKAIMIVVIDLNRFKYLNDTYGHSAGDRALIAFAERLKAVTKKGKDLIFRSGGDEFIVVLPVDSDEDIPEEVLETIFHKLKHETNNGFSIKVENDTQDFLLHASMGYAVLRKGDSKTAEEILHEADLEMYKDKKS